MRAGTSRTAVALPAAMAALLLVAALAAVTYRYPPPPPGLVVLGGLGLTGVFALAIARYDAAVAVGFLLLGIVRVEPAPPDLVFAIVLTVAAVTGRFDVSRVPVVVMVSLGFFIALNALSMADAVDPARAAFFVSITLYLAVFSLWLTGYVNSIHRARLVAAAYIATASTFAALSSLALLVPFPGHNELVANEGTRAAGLFSDPNVFGPFLVPAAMILLQEVMKPRLLRLRASVKVTLLFVLVMGVLFSYSRAAWLNLAISLLVLFAVFALRREGGTRLTAMVAIAMASGAVAAGTVALSGSSKFLEQRASVQSYDLSRFHAQEVGISLAESHPIGVGPGQFEPVVQYSAHNTYIRVYAEQGPPGLIGFAILLGATLVLAGRNVALGRSTYGIGSAALLAAWCGLLANSMFVDTLHWRHLWILAALIWAGSRAPVEAEASPTGPARPPLARAPRPAHVGLG
jgi:O-antigen ligase